MAKNTLAVCNQHVPTKVFPNHGHTIHKYADLPLCPLPGRWDVNTQIFGEKLDEAIVVALWTFLQDSCLSAGQIGHQCDCLLGDVRNECPLFTFSFLYPYENLTPLIVVSGESNAKFGTRNSIQDNFVVLPDLWALRLYFNPQFVTSKYPNPCKSFLEEEISPETKNPLSFSSPMFHHWSHNSCIYYVRIISDFHFLLSV